jgi:predicted DNA-binding transcriptional regulator AlpA
MGSDPELLTAAAVSALTGIPVSTLHDYAQRRESGLPPAGPPHLRLGPRRRRWLREDVVAWIESCRVVAGG